MLLVPGSVVAHIVCNRVRERCNVTKLSEACNPFKVAKENTQCALVCERTKGRTLSLSVFFF